MRMLTKSFLGRTSKGALIETFRLSLVSPLTKVWHISPSANPVSANKEKFCTSSVDSPARSLHSKTNFYQLNQYNISSKYFVDHVLPWQGESFIVGREAISGFNHENIL